MLGQKNDVIVYGGGSVYMFRPLTPEAEEWIKENVAGETQWLGDALAVEWRYVDDLVAGMREAGLTVR